MSKQIPGDRESIKYQTEQWVLGIPWHNVVRNECCPDFSCCRPELLAPKEVRERFAALEEAEDHGATSKMLGMFLGGAVVEAGGYVITEDEGHA